MDEYDPVTDKTDQHRCATYTLFLAIDFHLPSILNSRKDVAEKFHKRPDYAAQNRHTRRSPEYD